MTAKSQTATLEVPDELLDEFIREDVEWGLHGTD